MTFDPEDFPDKTFDELVADDEYGDWSDKDEADLEKEIKERRHVMELAASSAMLGRMMMDNKLTFREYIRLTNHVEDYQDEWGVTL